MFVKGENVFIYEDNFFYNNWLKSQDKTKNINDVLISYNLALENIEDLQYINLNKENLELIDIEKITSLQGIRNYAFLVIYFTEGKLRAFVKTYIENKEINKRINLRIYPENVSRTYEDSILTLKEEISQIWKAQNLIDANTPSFLDFFLDVKQMNDYLKLRSIFDSINLIEDYSVIEMTKEYTKIRLKYKGKIIKLRDKLLQKKINIKIVDNVWRITIN